MEWKDKARNVKSQTASRKQCVADVTKSYSKKAIDKINYAKAKRAEQRQSAVVQSTPDFEIDDESDKHFKKLKEREEKHMSKKSHKADLQKMYLEDMKTCKGH